MDKILVATDLSARSDRAVLRAIKLAKKYSASLTILNVINSDLPREIIDQTKKIAQNEIKACIKNKINNVEYKIEIIAGNEYQTILKLAKTEQADLIVLGIHRHVHDQNSLIGTTLKRIIKYSHLPVLIVKDRNEIEYDNILVGLGFDNYSQKSLKFSFQIANKNSKFHLVHSYQIPFSAFLHDEATEKQVLSEHKEELQKLLQNEQSSILANKYDVSEIIKEGSAEGILSDEIQYLKPNLLVLGTHSRTGLSNSIIGSISNKFLITPPCDILIVG